MDASHEPPPNNVRPRYSWWRITFVLLLAALLVQGILHVPYEISYWLLARAELLAEAGEFDAANSLIERAEKWAPKSPWNSVEKAEVLRREGRMDEAIATIDQLVANDPDSPFKDYRQKLIAINRSTRQILEDVRKLAADNKLTPEDKLHFALVVHQIGEIDLASSLLDLNDSDPIRAKHIHRAHRQILIAKGEYQAAADDAAECEKNLGEDSVRPEEKIEIALHLGRFDDAAKLCDELASNSTILSLQFDKMVDNNIAYFLAVANRNLDKAETRAIRAVENNPQSATVLDTRGFVFLRLGKFKEALADFDTALKDIRVDFTRLSIPAKSGRDDLERLAELAITKRTLAVVLYHRSLALEAAGKTKEMQADRDEIGSLGFEPNEHLF